MENQFAGAGINVCDKCGKIVEKSNDCVMIDAIAFGNNAGLLFNQSRHFMPTEDCKGSPSRNQYIEGNPRDDRGYAYISEYEQLVRDAYDKIRNQ